MIISYAWLSKEHPDPDLFHLRRLVRILKEMKSAQAKMKGGPVDELGVIIDFCALWQNRGGAVDSRTEVQFKEFKEGLKEINAPYAHQDISAVKLSAVPVHVSRKYDDRGWTLFESILIDGKAPSPKIFKGEDSYGDLNVLTCGDNFDHEAEPAQGFEFLKKFGLGERRPPCVPERFERQMQLRGKQAEDKGVDLFTSGADLDLVRDKYKKAFAEQVQAEKFDFEDKGWGDEEMESLSEVLACCSSLCHGFPNIETSDFKVWGKLFDYPHSEFIS